MLRLIIALVIALALVGCAKNTTSNTLGCGHTSAQHKGFYARMPCECGSSCPTYCKCDY